jgi:hypothetical protein
MSASRRSVLARFALCVCDVACSESVEARELRARARVCFSNVKKLLLHYYYYYYYYYTTATTTTTTTTTTTITILLHYYHY